MTIPRIQPYALPAADQLPDRVVTWAVDPARAALLIHDMQEYFVGSFPADESPMSEVIPRIARLREVCAEAGIPVFFSAQPGGMEKHDRGLLADFWGPGMSTSESHRRIIAPLSPRPGERVLTKWRYSTFFRTPLLEAMREQGRDQLIICGVYAHIGCLMTACDAFANDIETFLIADAVADFSADYHRMALVYAAERAAVVDTTDRMLSKLRPCPTW
ncbi:isochorismatase family protein [Streptomyces sp. NEAU-Y11]|uniref:isochorismatase family protein n=1 Tax=Streptomyces cucumeris TaxID=2962890 RepID=UPI0020C838E2|nr:isochorismatase family protein [Streptomyces sp. NEAU-Y11]MCP9211168.1 isochorismatase family protein [Streptomyces sp. NEAU-Y11]